MILQFKHAFVVVCLAIFANACATHTVKSTTYTPVVQDSQNVPEDFLLDVGITVFDPGIDEIDKDEEDTSPGE